MPTFDKLKLSGSTDGMGILLSGTATGSANTIHTAVNGTTPGVYDEIWLYAMNNHTASVDLTIEFGNAAAPANNIKVTIPAKSGLYLVVPGFILQNSAVVKAFAQTASVITIHGWVNTIRV